MTTPLQTASLAGSEYGIAEAPTQAYPPRVVAVVCSTRPTCIEDYFAGLDPLFSLQHEYPGEAFYVVSDNDTRARGQKPNERRLAILDAVSACLALGLDERKAIVYRQSDLPQALELLWNAPCTAATRSTRFAVFAHSRHSRDYLPIDDTTLFAANGLGIRATIMAGSRNQIHSCYYAGRLAKAFNAHYGVQVLTCPVPRLVGPTVMARAGRQHLGSGNVRSLSPFATPREIEEQLSRVCAGSTGSQASKRSRSTLLYLHRSVCCDVERHLSFEEQLAIGREYTRLNKMLAAEIVTYFSSAAARYTELRKRSDYVWDVLRDGAHHARLQADGTLDTIRQAIGAS